VIRAADAQVESSERRNILRSLLRDCYCVTVTVIEIVSLILPDEPVIVMVWAPSGAVALIGTVMVEVPEPGAGMGLGLKVMVLEFPDKVMAESKPPPTFAVMVEVPELPRATVMALGEAEMAKVFVVVVTVRVIVVDCLTPPPVPVMVMVCVPFTVVVSTARIMVEVPEPGAAIVEGVKVTVTPAGWPVADRAMEESKPFKMAVVIFDEPLLPCATETVVGEAEMVKLGVGVPVSASISALPFGLPKPQPKL
jgi:hypothetical protein